MLSKSISAWALYRACTVQWAKVTLKEPILQLVASQQRCMATSQEWPNKKAWQTRTNHNILPPYKTLWSEETQKENGHGGHGTVQVWCRLANAPPYPADLPTVRGGMAANLGGIHPNKREAVVPSWRPLPDGPIHQPHQTDNINTAIHDWRQKKFSTYLDASLHG